MQYYILLKVIPNLFVKDFRLCFEQKEFKTDGPVRVNLEIEL